MEGMNYEKIISIATFHFKRMRTTANFLYVADVKEKEGYYIVYGTFHGKKRTFYKKISLDKDGNLVDVMYFLSFLVGI